MTTITRPERARRQLDWATEQLANCRLCPHRCGVNRRRGKRGRCGAGTGVAYFQEFVNFSEEPELSPSHALLLTGCNLRCTFCHTAERLHDPAPVRRLTVAGLRRLAARGRAEGARNLNLYGGEPFVNLPGLLALVADSAEADLPPLVWNTNLYCAAEALAVLKGIPAVWLADFKFGNNRCAEKIAGAPAYWDVLRERLRELYRREPGKLLLRHLVLPGHVTCCTEPVLRWVAANLPGVRVSLRTAYLVMPAARGEPDLGRFLTPAEVAQARRLAAELGLELVPGADSAPQAAAAPAAADRGSVLEAEFVLSPRGEIYLRNAPREMMRLARELAGQTPANYHNPEHCPNVRQSAKRSKAKT